MINNSMLHNLQSRLNEMESQNEELRRWLALQVERSNSISSMIDNTHAGYS